MPRSATALIGARLVQAQPDGGQRSTGSWRMQTGIDWPC
jgi:hypothetical protein